MIGIGLGSNLGDRLENLRQAIWKLIFSSVIEPPIRFSSLVQSKAVVPDSSPESWSKLDFLNAVVIAQTSLGPRDLLKALLKVEAEMGRIRREKWAPRVVDLDLLFYDNEKIQESDLCLPHPAWSERAFVLEPLRELGWEPAQQRPSMKACQRLPKKLLPCELVGVVNLTPDSFSDGGQFERPDQVIDRVETLVQEGAGVIDLGAESTRPGAQALSDEEEYSRLESILGALVESKSQYPWLRWSLDSRKSEVWKRANELFPFNLCNDVSGGEDLELLRLAAERDCPVVLMHHLGIPVDRRRQLDASRSAVDQVLEWGVQKRDSLRQQFKNLRLIFDPGIGFGKSAEQSVELIQSIRKFQSLEMPLFVGHSRKSFLNLISHQDFASRDLESAVISGFLAKEGASYLRVHTPGFSQRAIETQFLFSARQL
ncbi:MAG: dihydropteroate synthase [Bradymonadales bacterium]|nr:MAG: dihydropteroate synthase [Bradymonadales bacterium]